MIGYRAWTRVFVTSLSFPGDGAQLRLHSAVLCSVPGKQVHWVALHGAFVRKWYIILGERDWSHWSRKYRNEVAAAVLRRDKANYWLPRIAITALNRNPLSSTWKGNSSGNWRLKISFISMRGIGRLALKIRMPKNTLPWLSWRFSKCT